MSESQAHEPSVDELLLVCEIFGLAAPLVLDRRTVLTAVRGRTENVLNVRLLHESAHRFSLVVFQAAERRIKRLLAEASSAVGAAVPNTQTTPQAPEYRLLSEIFGLQPSDYTEYRVLCAVRKRVGRNLSTRRRWILTDRQSDDTPIALVEGIYRYASTAASPAAAGARTIHMPSDYRGPITDL